MPLSNPHLLTTADLKCEYAVNPMGIDTLSPRLSWELKSERRGQRQKAYRILAATSPELLGEGLADLWDSGRVESRQSVHVEYAGAPLRSGMRCFWKVKTWDTSGNESPWSDSGFWEMGLLDENDWKGRWIGGEP
ncbi:MAG TPA: alfa-L-rhamnosidase, partial [Armatimonadota bacterium]